MLAVYGGQELKLLRRTRLFVALDHEGDSSTLDSLLLLEILAL